MANGPNRDQSLRLEPHFLGILSSHSRHSGQRCFSPVMNSLRRRVWSTRGVLPYPASCRLVELISWHPDNRWLFLSASQASSFSTALGDGTMPYPIYCPSPSHLLRVFLGGHDHDFISGFQTLISGWRAGRERGGWKGKTGRPVSERSDTGGHQLKLCFRIIQAVLTENHKEKMAISREGGTKVVRERDLEVSGGLPLHLTHAKD